MIDKKKPWQSKAMWMGVIALIALNLKSFGVLEISEADQNTIADTIVTVVENGAVILAMIFRWTATRQVKL